MPVGRQAKHTAQVFREELYEQVVYANDLSEGDGSPTLTSVTYSPAWAMDPDTNSDVLGDVKVPVDRVPNTPIDIYIVFSVDGASGGIGNIVWSFSYLIAGHGEELSTGGTNPHYTPALITSAPQHHFSKTANPIRIPSPNLEGHARSSNIQFKTERLADHALDTCTDDALLLKVVFEYTRYV